MNDLFENWDYLKNEILNKNPEEITMNIGDKIYRGTSADSKKEAINKLKEGPKYWSDNIDYAKSYSNFIVRGSERLIIVAEIISAENLFLNYSTYFLFHDNIKSFIKKDKKYEIDAVEMQCLYGVAVANSLFGKKYSGVFDVSSSGCNEILIEDRSIYKIIDVINVPPSN